MVTDAAEAQRLNEAILRARDARGHHNSTPKPPLYVAALGGMPSGYIRAFPDEVATTWADAGLLPSQQVANRSSSRSRSCSALPGRTRTPNPRVPGAPRALPAPSLLHGGLSPVASASVVAGVSPRLIAQYFDNAPLIPAGIPRQPDFAKGFRAA